MAGQTSGTTCPRGQSDHGNRCYRFHSLPIPVCESLRFFRLPVNTSGQRGVSRRYNPKLLFRLQNGNTTMEAMLTTEALIALLTLTSLELVLGIDNVIFIAILCGKLPEKDRDRARTLGLLLAVVSRILLVLAIGWVMGLSRVLFRIESTPITGKDVILILGGLFLIFKATKEIHHKLEHARSTQTQPPQQSSLGTVLVQVLMIDVVFSLDSVITAVGITEDLAQPIPVMITAILLSIAGMLAFSRAIVLFIERNPAIKILALSFLMLIGVLLVADGFGHHIPKGYIYSAMAFSFFVEMLQLWTTTPRKSESRESSH